MKKIEGAIKNTIKKEIQQLLQLNYKLPKE